MQSFTRTANGLARTLESPVGVNNPIIELSQPAEYNAIWDTGATASVITSRVVADCGLVPVSIQTVSTANGDCECNVYLIDLILPNHVRVKDLKVTEATIKGADLLVGMDVISKGDLAITNFDGKTAFSFRIPSSMIIDFVSHSYLTPVTKTGLAPGRNSPCPCGSGKKFKQCCGK